jgi:hypothetical protein
VALRSISAVFRATWGTRITVLPQDGPKIRILVV